VYGLTVRLVHVVADGLVVVTAFCAAAMSLFVTPLIAEVTTTTL
jgi:hypothetical protein